ncbi:kinase-like protein [Stagonosporopsis vannaccii]|nr:kinase-like protein [Stagonosporopsis vannaccii]
MSDSVPNQNGLQWVEGTFGLEPNWTKEPDINMVSQITRTQLNLNQEVTIEVVLHSKGTFTKLYKISTKGRAFSMRVSLPLDAGHRTESAVATIEFARQHTSIPLPRIIAYCSDNSNELGFEWILMDQAPGTTLYKAWRKLSWDAKEAIVKQLAEYLMQLTECKFQSIGNLYRQNKGFVVDRLVSTISYQGDHITNGSVRGPFTSSYEWLRARLQHVLAGQQQIIDTSCDEDEIEDAEFAQNLAKQLSELLPAVFLPSSKASELTALVHGDLSMHNITIDEAGKLAIMDWESVSAMPMWRACRLPKLFDDRVRGEQPLKEHYPPDSDEEDDKDDDGLDNEGITDLYWDHLLEYELTHLRKVFIEEMESRGPSYRVSTKQSILKDDFERAVEECGNPWRNTSVKKWIDLLAKGEPRTLTSILFSGPGDDQSSQTSMDWEKA